MSRARDVRATFARELGLRLRINTRLVYHLPYERALVQAIVTWRGRPLSRANVRLVVTCARQRVVTVLHTGNKGRVVFRFGTKMPNAVRVYPCRVIARATDEGRRRTSVASGALAFIHPLWLETKSGEGGRISVRIWGRRGEAVALLADGRVVARARIGRNGWVEVAPRGIRRGDRLSAQGRRGHHTHVISA